LCAAGRGPTPRLARDGSRARRLGWLGRTPHLPIAPRHLARRLAFALGGLPVGSRGLSLAPHGIALRLCGGPVGQRRIELGQRRVALGQCGIAGSQSLITLGRCVSRAGQPGIPLLACLVVCPRGGLEVALPRPELGARRIAFPDRLHELGSGRLALGQRGIALPLERLVVLRGGGLRGGGPVLQLVESRPVRLCRLLGPGQPLAEFVRLRQ
jgi:hypothetical protein